MKAPKNLEHKINIIAEVIELMYTDHYMLIETQYCSINRHESGEGAIMIYQINKTLVSIEWLFQFCSVSSIKKNMEEIYNFYFESNRNINPYANLVEQLVKLSKNTGTTNKGTQLKTTVGQFFK